MASPTGMLGIARAVASEIFTLESGRLLASLGLAGAVCCGVVFGWTEYGDTARTIGALTGVTLGLGWKIRKAGQRHRRSLQQDQASSAGPSIP